MPDTTVATATATDAVEIAAEARAAYAVVGDPEAMAGLAVETEAVEWVSGHGEVGSVFRGRNRNGAKTWSTTCTVTDAEPGRRFAFEVTTGPLKIARWQYDVEPLADVDGRARCRVTESTWDRRPRWFVRPGGWLTGVSDRRSASAEHIASTLAALKAHLEA